MKHLCTRSSNLLSAPCMSGMLSLTMLVWRVLLFQLLEFNQTPQLHI